MSIPIGVYDFFAYTIPGGIIVVAFGYVMQRYQLTSIDVANLSIFEIVVLVGVAYLVGYFVDAIVSRSWYKLFQSKNLFEKTMTEFNNRQRSLKVNFRDMDWYIWFAFVKRHNNEMASDVNQLKVINLMLRNSSFGLLVFAILFLLDFVERGYLPIYVIGSVICLLIAFVLGKESIKFQKWFYEGIFQSAISLVLKSRQLPIQFESESKSLSENKQVEEMKTHKILVSVHYKSRPTSVAGDAASPPAGGGETRTTRSAVEGSAPHPPRA